MTYLAFRSLAYYWRTHAAAALGVACAVAVLAGALLVGSSVRASLSALALSRLGRTEVIIAAEMPFTEALGQRLGARLASGGSVPSVAPLLVLDGIARHEPSGRRVANVRVYGVDDRFFRFHGVSATAPAGSNVLFSPDLAAELAAADGDAVLIRVPRPTDIPLDSLHGRKEDAGRSLRLTYRGTLGRDLMGEFSLAPQQGPVRAAFVSLASLQRDLDQTARVNAVLVAANGGATVDAAAVRRALASAVDAEDFGLRIDVPDRSTTILVASSRGVIDDATAEAVTASARPESLQITPVLTWLATRMTASSHVVPYSLISAIGPLADGDATLARCAMIGWRDHPSHVTHFHPSC
jgi:putative ABC transport system permease protein